MLPYRLTTEAWIWRLLYFLKCLYERFHSKMTGGARQLIEVIFLDERNFDSPYILSFQLEKSNWIQNFFLRKRASRKGDVIQENLIGKELCLFSKEKENSRRVNIFKKKLKWRKKTWNSENNFLFIQKFIFFLSSMKEAPKN